MMQSKLSVNILSHQELKYCLKYSVIVKNIVSYILTNHQCCWINGFNKTIPTDVYWYLLFVHGGQWFLEWILQQSRVRGY